MKIADLKQQGVIDRLTGTFFTDTPYLDKFRSVAETIREVDADEAHERAAAAYRLMWSTSEQLAETVKELRSLGHRDLREMRVLDILDVAIKALEAEGIGT